MLALIHPVIYAQADKSYENTSFQFLFSIHTRHHLSFTQLPIWLLQFA